MEPVEAFSLDELYLAEILVQCKQKEPYRAYQHFADFPVKQASRRAAATTTSALPDVHPGPLAYDAAVQLEEGM
jgi:hypothetical protein